MPRSEQRKPSGKQPAIGLNVYIALWLIIVVFFAREYLILNGRLSGQSILAMINQHFSYFLGRNLSPKAGRPLSFTLGWIGFSIICLTNLYVLRKRLSFMRDWGNITGWFNFHIFCGLLGPSLIVFHTNFKVGGLVSISFVCMMISFASGVFGRYFYAQIVQESSTLQQTIQNYSQALNTYAQKADGEKGMQQMRLIKVHALRRAGCTDEMIRGHASLWSVIGHTIVGDIQLALHPIKLPAKFSSSLRSHLKTYARSKRRYMTLEQFNRVMGYWHTFHMPFAIFMYVVTIIHIVSALIFRVNH